MLRLLLGIPETDFSALQPGTVLLAEELSPSAVSVLNSANVAGIVLGKGGPTSHSAILARALEIPAVLGVEDRVMDTEAGETVIVDGNRGCAVFSPGAEIQAVYEGRRRDFQQLRASLRVFCGPGHRHGGRGPGAPVRQRGQRGGRGAGRGLRLRRHRPVAHGIFVHGTGLPAGGGGAIPHLPL